MSGPQIVQGGAGLCATKRQTRAVGDKCEVEEVLSL